MPGGVEEESVEPPEPVEEAPEGYQFMPALAREAEDLSEYESDDEGKLKLGPDGKPVWKIVKIRVTHDTEAMKALAIKSVGRIEGFYTKNDALIDMVTPRDLDRHGKPRRPFARRTSKAHLTSVLNSMAHWYTEKPSRGGEEDEEELQHVPSDSFFDSIEPAVPKVAAGVSTSTPEALRKDIVRFAFRGARQDIFWAYEFAEQRARPKVASTFAAISGTAGFQRQLEWLRVNTTIPSDVIDAVERDYLAGLYVTPEMRREARAFAKEFPESCSVMFDDE